jgi:hypothetical protein
MGGTVMKPQVNAVRLAAAVAVIAVVAVVTPVAASAAPNVVQAPLPGDASTTDPGVNISAISCPTTSRCVANGDFSTSNSDVPGATWLWSGGTWLGDRLPLGGGVALVTVDVLGVSCATTTSCTAAGDFNANGEVTPAIWKLAAGRWTVEQAPLPSNSATAIPAEINGISCPKTTSCFGGGSYTTNNGGQQPAIWKLAGGTWSVTPVSLPSNAAIGPTAPSILGISCPTTTSCVAVGGYESNGSSRPAIWTLASQTWKVRQAAVPANAAAKSVSSLDAVSCPTTTTCSAGGTYIAADGTAQAAFWKLAGGNWSVKQAPVPVDEANNSYPGPEITSISCSKTTNCMAGGSYYSTSNFKRASIWTLSSGKWSAMRSPIPANAMGLIPGAVTAKGGPSSAIGAISCPPSKKTSCIAGGTYVAAGGKRQGFFLQLAINGQKVGASQSVTTTTEAPTTTTTMPTTTTTTTAAAPVSQITIASLDAALAQQANAVPPSPGQPPGTWTVTCGPPSASLAVGSYILCSQFNPSIGGSEEVIQITGNTPSSFTVAAGPGSSIPCSGLNAGEQAAFTADGNACDPNG